MTEWPQTHHTACHMHIYVHVMFMLTSFIRVELKLVTNVCNKFILHFNMQLLFGNCGYINFVILYYSYCLYQFDIIFFYQSFRNQYYLVCITYLVKWRVKTTDNINLVALSSRYRKLVIYLLFVLKTLVRDRILLTVSEIFSYFARNR